MTSVSMFHQLEVWVMADEKPDNIKDINDDDKALDKVGEKNTPNERAEEFLKELKKKK